MLTAAEQYRQLVAKLEAINPSQPVATEDSLNTDESHDSTIPQNKPVD